MSYTAVNGMRSTRYPLSGLGCGCSSTAGMGCGCNSTSGLGLVMSDFTDNWQVVGLAVGLGWVIGEMRSRRMRANRRRR